MNGKLLKTKIIKFYESLIIKRSLSFCKTLVIQDFNTKLKNQVKETIITNEDFLYAFCINVTIYFEKESDIMYDEEDTFLNDFKTSLEVMFFDNMKAQVKKYHSNNT